VTVVNSSLAEALRDRSLVGSERFQREHGVADFGIARALGGGDERLTDAWLTIGPPQYMNPEQATAEQ
jgi:hypothetical protein